MSTSERLDEKRLRNIFDKLSSDPEAREFLIRLAEMLVDRSPGRPRVIK